MGKITVKHYLEKRINPKNIGDNVYYPVYNQITINRKTTQIRSHSSVTMSEQEFEKYTNGENYVGEFFNIGISNRDFFEKEPERIKRSFEIAIDYLDKEFTGIKIDMRLIKTILSHIENTYLMYTDRGLIELAWNYQICTNKKERFYQSFDKRNTLIKSLNNIKKNFEVDLKDKIPIEDYIFWNNIQLLLSKLGRSSIFIDFVEVYKEEINKIAKIKNKDNFIRQIEEIITFSVYSD